MGFELKNNFVERVGVLIQYQSDIASCARVLSFSAYTDSKILYAIFDQLFETEVK